MKILDIVTDLSGLIEKYQPDICGIEKLFFLNNQKTGIDVAQARGAIVYILTKKGIPIVEYTPLQVKRGICGNGAAVKKQVQNTLKILFGLDAIPKPDDAADALAIAYLTGLQKRGI